MAKRKREAKTPPAVAAPPAVPKPLTDRERAEVQACAQRILRRPRAPKFKAVGEHHVGDASGLDAFLFAARITAAVGCANHDGSNLLVSQVAESVGGDVLATKCNTSLALLTGIQPKNEVEGMLAVQMVGCHNLAMAMLQHATKTGRVNSLATYGNLASKLLRTFTAQTEALARLRGQTGQQTVRVEHVTVEAGGQAVVGAVTTQGGMRAETDERPHTPRSRGRLKHGNPSGDPTNAPRCGARTRAGTPCKGPCVRGRRRCRMHGGAAGSGAQSGNRNAWRHDEYSAWRKAELRALKMLLSDLRADATLIAAGSMRS